MQATVIGAGLVGGRASGMLASAGHDVTLVSRNRAVPPMAGVRTIGGSGRSLTSSIPDQSDVVILASDSMDQVALAEQLLRRNMSVVSTADRPAAVRALWTLGAVASDHGVGLVVGAGCSPGLSSLLVAHLAAGLDSVDTITTARFGTGGPTCAREHHRSMAATAWEVRESGGEWVRGGSGRTLVWFPEPVGAQDCYRAGLSEPFLLQQAFPQARRIQSLQASTRRDRATARLPMLRRPHAEGRLGAVWAEVRGTRSGQVEHRVMAAVAPQATAAAAVAVAVAQDLVDAQESLAGRVCASQVPDVNATLRALSPCIGLLTYDGSTVVDPGSVGPVQAARKWRLPRELSDITPTGDRMPSEQAYLPKVKEAETDYSL